MFVVRGLPRPAPQTPAQTVESADIATQSNVFRGKDNCLGEVTRACIGNGTMTVTITGDGMPLGEIQRRIDTELGLIPATSWTAAEAGSVLFILRAIRKGREIGFPNVIPITSCRWSRRFAAHVSDERA
jgi:hypothetical protein